MPAVALETHQLTRDFDEVRAVDRLDLSVDAGTLYGFLGPNGAGKSTTIKMLTGLLAPTSGSMTLLGGDPLVPSEALEIKSRVGAHILEVVSAPVE